MKLKNIISICVLITCVILTASCTEDSLFKNNVVDSGTPVTAKLTFTVPGSSQVTVSRAGTSHSEVGSLDIFIYDANGNFESAVEANIKTSSSSTSGRTYTAEFATTTGSKILLGIANAEETSEWVTDMDALKKSNLSLSEMKEKVLSLSQNLVTTGKLPAFEGNRMLLIGEQSVTIAERGTITGNDGVNNLRLYRTAVEVTFNIENGTHPDSEHGIVNMDFNPSSYRVYNVPKGTRIGKDNVTSTSKVSEFYYNIEAVTIPPMDADKYSFTFYMPENIQTAKKTITESDNDKAYSQRDKWSNAGDAATSPENKEWTNAPQYGTFIVITGAFNATDANNNLVQTGTVSYTIHLGDFSTDVNNYSTERDYSYTYNVTVNGVDNIVAEAEKKEENQSGAEGGVINVVDNYTQDYTLDAHYEQVFLEYNITQMATAIQASLTENPTDDDIKKAIGDWLLMIVETPYTKTGTEYVAPYRAYLEGLKNNKTEEETKEAAVGAMDYKWVEFLSQTATSKLTEYPGRNTDGTPKGKQIDGYDLSVALGRAIFDQIKASLGGEALGTGEKYGIQIETNETDLVARFTAFVDEYYYMHRPFEPNVRAEWDEFVNTDMRRMMLAMNVNISPDHNSQSVYLYSNISQRSMQTFYDLKKAGELDAFGIEAFNETPRTKYYGNPAKDGSSMGNGYMNTIEMLGGTIEDNGSNCNVSGKWASFVNWAQNGYLTTNTSTDPVASHKIPESQPAGEEILAYRACMSRNRDLNGNGDIDPDEVRWYMPAVHEYIRIALGSAAIASESQLYHGQKSDLTMAGYPGKFAEYGSLYYTSSSGGARMYYTVEKGSYSSDFGAYDGYWPSAVRCIRHLPNTKNDMVTTPDAFYTLRETEEGNHLLDYTGILQANLLRETPLSKGGYRPHHDDEGDINRFYKGMVVAKDYLRDYDGYVKLFSFDEVTKVDDVCATYSEKDDGSDIGYWRTPNQVELTSMSSRPDLFFKDNPNNDEKRTKAIHPLYKNDGPKNIFDVNTNIVVEYRLWGALSRTQFSNPDCRCGFAFRGTLLSCPSPETAFPEFRGGVRCVRDATDTEMVASH